MLKVVQFVRGWIPENRIVHRRDTEVLRDVSGDSLVSTRARWQRDKGEKSGKWGGWERGGGTLERCWLT